MMQDGQKISRSGQTLVAADKKIVTAVKKFDAGWSKN